jgi:hypothetical protein
LVGPGIRRGKPLDFYLRGIGYLDNLILIIKLEAVAAFLSVLRGVFAALYGTSLFIAVHDQSDWPITTGQSG